MEGSPIIAGILFVCVLLAVAGAGLLLKRRFGKRGFGIGGAIAMIPISWVLMLLASNCVSTDSYYWYVAVGACTGVSVLVSQFLFCEPPSG
jgi:hypothetical protein